MQRRGGMGYLRYLCTSIMVTWRLLGPSRNGLRRLNCRRLAFSFVLIQKNVPKQNPEIL